MVNGEPYPLDMRGELDDTAAFKNFKKWVSDFPGIPFLHVIVGFTLTYQLCRWGGIEFPLPFGRVLSPTESFIHELDEKVLISGLCFYLSFLFLRSITSKIISFHEQYWICSIFCWLVR
jgi:hypothetical protein